MAQNLILCDVAYFTRNNGELYEWSRRSMARDLGIDRNTVRLALDRLGDPALACNPFHEGGPVWITRDGLGINHLWSGDGVPDEVSRILRGGVRSAPGDG